MRLFPAESRALTESLLAALQWTVAGATKSTKELGTIRSRRIHYLLFVDSLNWDDDYTSETMPSHRSLIQLALLYAQHLGTGSTIMCRTIKVDTIKKYILSVSQFLLSLFGDHPRDYRKECPTSTTMAVELTKVYAELARWEKSPQPPRALYLGNA